MDDIPLEDVAGNLEVNPFEDDKDSMWMWSKILGSFSAQRLYFCDVNESWDVRRLATWDVPTFKKFMRLCSVSIFRHIWHQHKSEWTQCTLAICNWLQEVIDSLEKGELADEETVRACKHLMTHFKNIWIFIVWNTSVGVLFPDWKGS